MAKTIVFDIARVASFTFEPLADGSLSMRTQGYLLNADGDTWPKGVEGWSQLSPETTQALQAALDAVMMETVAIALDLQSGQGVVQHTDARTYRQSKPRETPLWVKP